MSHDYTRHHPQPGPPTQLPPRWPLLYSTLGPGSAVTYTAERYSYGRMGQKETQVRHPPVLGETGPLDQGGATCLQLPLPTSTAPTHGCPSASLGICLSVLLLTRGLMPPDSTCLPGAATSKSPAHQPLPPATKLLGKQGLGAQEGLVPSPVPCSGGCPRGGEGTACMAAKGQGSRVA